MSFRPYVTSFDDGISLAQLATSPIAQACVVGFAGREAGMSIPATWINIYRLAYERARRALEPSRFQEMLEPRWN